MGCQGPTLDNLYAACYILKNVFEKRFCNSFE
jgi:hypothetical protein